MYRIRFIENFPDKCPDCRKTAEPARSLPELWVEKALLRINEYFSGININGFVINFREQRVVSVTLKKEFSFNLKEIDTLKQSLKIFLKKYIKHNSKDFSKYLSLASTLNVPFYFITFPHMYPDNNFGYEVDQKLIFIYEISSLEQIKLKHEFNVKDLENWLHTEKNFQFEENKPLDYADMNLSCYISKYTKNQLPGDIDYCVFFKSSIAFIFEFKTHNLDKPIENENMENYQKQDFRRFNVYKHLLSQIRKNQDYRPIFVYLVWGTDINLENHKKIKLDFMYYNNAKWNHLLSELIINPEVSETISELSKTIENAINKFKAITEKK
jgi:glutaredoxin